MSRNGNKHYALKLSSKYASFLFMRRNHKPQVKFIKISKIVL